MVLFLECVFILLMLLLFKVLFRLSNIRFRVFVVGLGIVRRGFLFGVLVPMVFSVLALSFVGDIVIIGFPGIVNLDVGVWE